MGYTVGIGLVVRTAIVSWRRGGVHCRDRAGGENS